VNGKLLSGRFAIDNQDSKVGCQLFKAEGLQEASDTAETIWNAVWVAPCSKYERYLRLI